MKFRITIEMNEDGKYMAEFSDLLEYLSDRDTLEEALESMSEAITGCLKSKLKIAQRTSMPRPSIGS
jgi:predicted RNase H-like HicB family nuclease